MVFHFDLYCRLILFVKAFVWDNFYLCLDTLVIQSHPTEFLLNHLIIVFLCEMYLFLLMLKITWKTFHIKLFILVVYVSEIYITNQNFLFDFSWRRRDSWRIEKWKNISTNMFTEFWRTIFQFTSISSNHIWFYDFFPFIFKAIIIYNVLERLTLIVSSQ